MRPISLTIEGLRSFRSSVTLEFTDRDHIAIVGDTGAGKSSILEAMTYALYGRTTFTVQGNQELMNDTSTNLRVVFRFQVCGEDWEVTRTLRRSGKGEVGQAKALLRRLGDDDEAIEQIEQVRRVDLRIKELLGLDSEAFLRTVVLPQGRFAQLLVADTPTERSAILRQVWRTHELEAAGEEAQKALQVAEQVRTRLEDAASGHPPDPEAHLTELREKLTEASAEVAASNETERAAEADRETVRVAEGEAKTAACVMERLGRVDVERVAAGLEPLAERARGFAEQLTALDQRLEELETERGRIPSDDGPTSEEVAAALRMLPSLDALVTSSEEAAADLRDSIELASAKNATAEELEKGAADARTRSESHAVARPPLEDAVLAAKKRLHEIEQYYRRSEDREANLREAEKQVEGLRTKEAGYAEPLEQAKERASRATREGVEAEEHLTAAQRSESAAHAARQLHPGDSCPVCRRKLLAGWEAPADAGLDEAGRIEKEARKAARAAADTVTRLETELQGIRRRVVEAEVDVAECEARSQEARQELAGETDLGPSSSLPDRHSVLAPLMAAKEEAEAALADHCCVADRLDGEANRQDTAAKLGRQDAANAHRTAVRSRQVATSRLKDLMAALRAIPDPFRPELDLPSDAAEIREVDTKPIARNAASAKAREHTLNKRRRELERLAVLIGESETSRTALARRRTDELERPLRELARRLQNHRDVLVESVSQLGLDREIPHAAATEVEALESHLGDLRTAWTDIATAAEQQSRAAARRVEGARTRLKTVGENMGESVDSGDPDAVLRKARAQAEEARFRERTAGEDVESFAAVASDVRCLLTLLDETKDKVFALRDLSEALKDGRFPKWLTLRRSRRLLIHASQMLGEVSGGKYSFVDPQETDEQWRVLDRDSNQPRTPASLSGGEQFLASLSLALGMVEMMARSGGRLEAIFLDEGFGSLDRRNLDAAIEALEKVASTGRMVAVISHVRAVAEQIDHVLAVSREATGSQAVWLSARQREQLAASDLELEAMTIAGLGEASPLGGLLD